MQELKGIDFLESLQFKFPNFYGHLNYFSTNGKTESSSIEKDKFLSLDGNQVFELWNSILDLVVLDRKIDSSI